MAYDYVMDTATAEKKIEEAKKDIKSATKYKKWATVGFGAATVPAVVGEIVFDIAAGIWGGVAGIANKVVDEVDTVRWSGDRFFGPVRDNARKKDGEDLLDTKEKITGHLRNVLRGGFVGGAAILGLLMSPYLAVKRVQDRNERKFDSKNFPWMHFVKSQLQYRQDEIDENVDQLEYYVKRRESLEEDEKIRKEREEAKEKRMVEYGVDKVLALIMMAPQVKYTKLTAEKVKVCNKDYEFCDLSNGFKIVYIKDKANRVRVSLRLPTADNEGQALPSEMCYVDIPDEFRGDVIKALSVRAKQIEDERKLAALNKAIDKSKKTDETQKQAEAGASRTWGYEGKGGAQR